MRSSFTLIEVLIATLILALVGVGTLSLITQSVSLVREARDLILLTLIAEDLATRDILDLLPDWEVRGEKEGFKWSREIVSTQISAIELRKYTVSKGGRSVDFLVVKRR
ncbi:MAG: hypothetical protein N3C62_00690 [Synergistetes bacterium]|nr:hypothetical protein [Synergistota bacterium]MCX8127255.1 hypothetical protein [Synergistota bacterium]MDW8191859.1 hypothetical protein [Synergistota bacterium]